LYQKARKLSNSTRVMLREFIQGGNLKAPTLNEVGSFAHQKQNKTIKQKPCMEFKSLRLKCQQKKTLGGGLESQFLFQELINKGIKKQNKTNKQKILLLRPPNDTVNLRIERKVFLGTPKTSPSGFLHVRFFTIRDSFV
jgi:hypothetical protein